MNTTGKIVATFVALLVISGLIFALAQCGPRPGEDGGRGDAAGRPAEGPPDPGGTPPTDGTGDPAHSTPTGPDQAAPLLAEARRQVGADDLVAARAPLYRALSMPSIPQATRAEVKDLLGHVNMQCLFSPRMIEEKEEYFIQPGDSLGAIARRFGTTIEAIRRANGIEGDLIRPGDRLRVFTGKCRIEVDCDTNRLTLLVNDRFFREYSIGTGRYDRTPKGDFKIVDKVIDPVWYKDNRAIPFGDEDNILGTRWMSIDMQGFGLHGTWDESTIGTASSAGCVRMRNADVEELFDIVPTGTPVRILAADTGNAT